MAPFRGKLGKKPPKFNAKTLDFARFLKAPVPLPPPLAKRAWEYKIPSNAWGMYGNDTIGDCTCASKAHILMVVSANAGHLITPPLADVIEMYSAVSGYDPSTGANDNGAAMTDVNDYLLSHGLSGRKVLGWVQIDQTNRTHFEQCVALFGACDVGVQLPNSAMTQFNNGEAWDIVKNDGGIDGGHDVPYFGYGSQGETCVTWAQLQPTGIPWFMKYVDEGYGIIWDDWFDTTTNMSPSHFDRDGLWFALQALKAS